MIRFFLLVHGTGIACDFEGARTRREFSAPKALTTRGSGTMLPHKFVKFRVSEMPVPAFSAGHFQ